MKSRLACLLRRWARRLDPSPPASADFSTTTAQAFVTSAGWSWNGAVGTATPDPPRLRVVR